MDEIRDLMHLLLDITPAGMTRLESLMNELRETRAIRKEMSEAMEAIEEWAAIVDSADKPTYH